MTEREREIFRLLCGDDSISVSELGRKLGVSEVTIRSDFRSLAEKGYIVPRRGGGTPAFDRSILDRMGSGMAEKGRIAAAAAELVEDGDQIMVVSGTSTSLLARHLMGRRNIHIVTTSTLLLPYIRLNPGVTVTLVGGEFRPAVEGVVGPIAIETIRRFHVKYAFLGSDGFSPENGVTAQQMEEAEVGRTMAEQAEETVLLADASKYGKAGFARMLPLDGIGRLITDESLSLQARGALKEFGLPFEAV